MKIIAFETKRDHDASKWWLQPKSAFRSTRKATTQEDAVEGVFANRNEKRDFVINELERRATDECPVYIASAFFTQSDVVERILQKGCKVLMVVRLGFPTSPFAIEKVKGHPNLQLRIYTGHAFHPKLYIFGDELALVGSANLTHAALLTNQEVMVSIESDDARLMELMAIFEDYWDGAEVPTEEQLAFYKEIYKQNEQHQEKSDALAQKVLEKLGDKSPANINRGQAKPKKQSLFLSNFRRTYQEAVSAFNIVRQTYEASGYRKVPESAVPLRIEIDSFISWVREKIAPGEAWQSSPFRTASEQEKFIGDLIVQWRDVYWKHFEEIIVGKNYPRFCTVFDSREAILAANDSELFDALGTLHSFYDRFRFFDGGVAGWKAKFPTFNDPIRVRETLAYLVCGEGEIVQRMANAIFDPRWKLNEFGQANVQELIGWRNREDLPIINGRTTKVLRYFGSKVRQL